MPYVRRQGKVARFSTLSPACRLSLERTSPKDMSRHLRKNRRGSLLIEEAASHRCAKWPGVGEGRMGPGRASVLACPSAMVSERTTRDPLPPNSRPLLLSVREHSKIRTPTSREQSAAFLGSVQAPARPSLDSLRPPGSRLSLIRTTLKGYVATSQEEQPTLLVDGQGRKPAMRRMAWPE